MDSPNSIEWEEGKRCPKGRLRNKKTGKCVKKAGTKTTKKAESSVEKIDIILEPAKEDVESIAVVAKPTLPIVEPKPAVHLPRSDSSRGKIYLASMNMRGAWAQPISSNSIKVNVTSAQGKSSANRRDFSPMTPVDGGYKGFWNFESYWQSGKVFEDVPHDKSLKWWKSIKEAKRRYPGSKGKKVLYAVFEGVDGKLDYVESRKKVYVPEYTELIKNRPMVEHWKQELDSGKDITIYDFDGPRKPDGGVECLEVTEEMLREKIEDPTFPFGHGYSVAMLFAGIDYHRIL